MLHIFLPRKSGANTQNLRDAGLGELLRPGDDNPQCCDLAKLGPGDQPGQVWGWGAQAYQPDRQVWMKARGQDYWWGYDQGDDLSVILRRKTMFNGREVRFNETSWLMPTVDTVPHVIELDASGELCRCPDVPYAAFAREAFEILTAFAEHAGDEQSLVNWDWKRRAKLVVTALSLNYRINLEIATYLRLLRDTDLWTLAMLIGQGDQVRSLFEDLEKKSVPAIESGAAPSAA